MKIKTVILNFLCATLLFSSCTKTMVEQTTSALEKQTVQAKTGMIQTNSSVSPDIAAGVRWVILDNYAE